jgi:hypothetical protein
MTTDIATDAWGPLAEPLHGPVPEGRPPFRDNAYLVFWSDDRRVLGVAHFSTSPNAEGRRARLSISVDGRSLEIIEGLDRWTYASKSLEFGLDGTLRVDHPQLQGTVISTPLFAPADYSVGEVIPPLVAGEPLQHHQQAAEITGDLVLDGTALRFTGRAMRDRTWGYREESSNLREYLAILVVFRDHAFTLMRFTGTDGTDRTEGFVLPAGDEPVRRLTGMDITRDAAGLLHSVLVTDETGSVAEYTSVGRAGGFWVPMGWTKRGPAMSAYDEFVALRTSDGSEAFGMAEHGVVRQLY